MYSVWIDDTFIFEGRYPDAMFSIWQDMAINFNSKWRYEFVGGHFHICIGGRA